jgi:pyruvate/2-oxoglutarate dehydrogenase complex dihydrolipoamide dehydrogenase (E3) component
MRNMLLGNQERTLMKLVVDRKTDQLLGCAHRRARLRRRWRSSRPWP